ncbi:MAG: type II secretion system protein [Pirellulales bacterium]
MPCRARPRPSFTLVEMLVVIVIIGILASLITVAAVAALDKAHQTQIKLEMDQLASAFERYKNQYGSYPPNFFVARDRKDRDGILNPLKRHFKKAFPRQRPEDLEPLITLLTGNAQNNITPAEAINFWLGGFSSDPEYPLTGPGGPIISPQNTQDQSLNRTSLFEFDETRLKPTRQPPITQITNNPRTDIQLLSYHPPKLTQPFVYFDTSRTPPFIPSNTTPTVPPAGQSTVWWPAYLDSATGNVLIRPYVHWGKTSTRPIDWINPKKFQILSTGTDDEWGGEFLAGTNINTDIRIIYPDGPYTDPLTEHADNLVSFSPKTLEDSQP